jgi:5-methylcytosine-specific restriction endonuclease McrA
MPPRPCARHGQLIPKGQRCPQCRREQEANRGPRVYDRAAWRRIRLAVLQRDGYQCQLRRPCCTGRATTVDHITPVSRGGVTSVETCVAACRECNSSKRDR